MADISIRNFAYRHPRFATKLEMDFVVGDTVILGVCESISDSSVFVKLSDIPSPGAAGVVTLYCGGQSWSVHALVAASTPGASDQDHAALLFAFQDEEERESVRSLITQLKLRRVG